jgi:hypothetical protein
MRRAAHIIVDSLLQMVGEPEVRDGERIYSCGGLSTCYSCVEFLRDIGWVKITHEAGRMSEFQFLPIEGGE